MSGPVHLNLTRKQSSDAVVHLEGKGTKGRKVLALLDSGNQLGPIVLLETVLNLGFHRQDLQGKPRAIQVIGGGQLQTGGTIRLKYFFPKGHPSRPLEDTFHVMEQLVGDYQVIIPAELLE